METKKRRLIAESARKEAKKQARKRKNEGMVPFDQGVTKHRKFKIIQDNMDQDLEEETPQPFIVVCTRKEELQIYAFIDSKANGNTISYELYTRLKDAQLTQSNTVFQAYMSH